MHFLLSLFWHWIYDENDSSFVCDLSVFVISWPLDCSQLFMELLFLCKPNRIHWNHKLSASFYEFFLDLSLFFIEYDNPLGPDMLFVGSKIWASLKHLQSRELHLPKVELLFSLSLFCFLKFDLKISNITSSYSINMAYAAQNTVSWD